MLKRAAYWAANTGVLLGVWFLFVMKAEVSELVAGAAAAALAAFGMELAREQTHPRFAPHFRDLAQIYSIPASAVADTVALTLMLPERPQGFFRLLPFDAGDDDAESAGRRALGIIYATIPPNTLVIGIDRRHDRMLAHYVKEAGIPGPIRRLGAPEERA